VKEWSRVSKPASGPAVVTVTLVDGNLSARWSTKAYGQIKAAVIEARREAAQAITELREATS
jgi:hypothetical protein